MNEKSLALNAAQLRCIASPIRSELMGAAVRLHRFSVNEAAEDIGRKPKALYPHIRQMVDVGLLRQVEERRSGKRIEAVYGPVSERIVIPRDNFDPEFREAMQRKLKGMIRQTEREYMRYLDGVTDTDDSFSLRYFLKLSPSRALELKEKLMDVAKWAMTVEDEDGAIAVSATFLAVPHVARKDD